MAGLLSATKQQQIPLGKHVAEHVVRQLYVLVSHFVSWKNDQRSRREVTVSDAKKKPFLLQQMVADGHYPPPPLQTYLVSVSNWTRLLAQAVLRAGGGGGGSYSKDLKQQNEGLLDHPGGGKNGVFENFWPFCCILLQKYLNI